MVKYKFLEDVAIADIAYEAYGKDLNELFENSALAIFELTADMKDVNAEKTVEFEVEGDKLDMLLYDFLSEILFLKDSKYMIFKSIKAEVKGNKAKAIMKGTGINPKTQKLENDIKAITLHMFKLEKTKDGYMSRVVVDL